MASSFRSVRVSRQENGSLGLVVREREDGSCYVDGFADETSTGVMRNDRILAVGGTFVRDQRHLRELLDDAADPVVLLLRRDEPEDDEPDEPSRVKPTGDRRFGLGPLQVVLERARSDVDSLCRAYDANAFTRWQLKSALRERTPTLNGYAVRTLKQAKNDEAKQRMLMLMLAHDLSPGDIFKNVLTRDKTVHLARDNLAKSRGYWVAVSQERMRELYEENGNRRVYVHFPKADVAPLPANFTECGFARTRVTMNVDKVREVLRAQVQCVQFAFSSNTHPDEPPLVVEYDLYRTEPYIDLLGLVVDDSSNKKRSREE